MKKGSAASSFKDLLAAKPGAAVTEFWKSLLVVAKLM